MKTTVPAAAFLFAFWLILTGSLHPVDLAVGLLVSMVLGVWAARFLWTAEAPTISPGRIPALLAYLLTLGWTIVAAALQVARMVLDPRLPVDPVTITHRTSLTRDVSKVALANSLTLTPGTLAVDVEGDTFHVHCLEAGFAAPLVTGKLETRVARVFEEGGSP